MSRRGKLAGICIFAIFAVACDLLPVRCSAEQSRVVFEKDICYDVYYAIQDRPQVVSNVKIVGITMLGDAAFLEILPVNLPQERSGYILFASIRSILPVGFPRPQKVGNK